MSTELAHLSGGLSRTEERLSLLSLFVLSMCHPMVFTQPHLSLSLSRVSVCVCVCGMYMMREPETVHRAKTDIYFNLHRILIIILRHISSKFC